MSAFHQDYNDIKNLLSNWNGSGSEFSSHLRNNQIPHLSYSSISALDFCPYRYYLEYIAGYKLDPRPTYFIKGQVFHEIAARYYEDKSKGDVTDLTTIRRLVPQDLEEEHRIHIENAVLVLQQNLWSGLEIRGIEQPFVIFLSEDLPPCVGVIDIILQRENHYVLVDHKTGRTFFKTDFYDPSKLQMSIYREYITREYSPNQISLYYDKYRWINNLDRIRKPPFEREKIRLHSNAWHRTQLKLRKSFLLIQDYSRKGNFPRNGECFRCPYRDYC